MTESLHIVHAADIHLDSPLRGLDSLGNEDLAGELRRATSEAFRNLIDWTLQNSVDAVVLAGDIYDGDLRDYTTGRFFAEQLARLHDADIPAFVVSGNHDAASVITKSLRLPPNAHQLATDEPQSIRLDDMGLAVHGQGFATKAVKQNLAADYPVAIPGMVNVGLLHTSVAGYEGHDTYAPCSVTDLTSKGYEYFALGHVHQQQTLEEGQHAVAFSGNLQGRHVKESGPKGLLSVHLSPGEQADIKFVECDVARWGNRSLDVTGAADWDDVIERVSEAIHEESDAADGLPLILRMAIEGESVAASALTDQQRLAHETALAARPLGVTVARIRSSVRLPQRDQVLPRHVVEHLEEIAAATETAQVEEMLKAVRAETRDELLKMDLDVDLDTAAVVAQASEMLLARLGGQRR